MRGAYRKTNAFCRVQNDFTVQNKIPPLGRCAPSVGMTKWAYEILRRFAPQDDRSERAAKLRRAGRYKGERPSSVIRSEGHLPPRGMTRVGAGEGKGTSEARGGARGDRPRKWKKQKRTRGLSPHSRWMIKERAAKLRKWERQKRARG